MNLKKSDGKKKNTELANRPHLIEFQGDSENIKSQELPNSSQGYSFITSLFGNSDNTSALNFKYEFRDGKLYAFEELRNMELNEKFNFEEGLLECNPSKIFTRVYSVNLKDISFTQVMNFDGVASGNFITETCSGTHPFSIKRLDFDEKSVSEPLPVTIGYPRAISLKVSEES